LEENKEEEDYQKQIEYIRTFYPDKKVKIKGYGTTNIDVVSNKGDLHSIIKNYNIKCSFCNKPLSDDWIAVFHNPKQIEKPVNLLFFCHNDKVKCVVRWGEQNLKQNARS